MKLFVASLLSLCLGCSYQTFNHEPNTRIVVDLSVSEATLQPWLAYAGTRSRWMTQTYREQNPGAGLYQYTFAEEVAARSACARVWLERREFQKAKPDPYLDQLIEVFKSGYIPEYTWIYFRDPQWPPPAKLRLAEFEAWRKTNLKDHKAETRARAEFEAERP
jgi:hypothetical protein